MREGISGRNLRMNIGSKYQMITNLYLRLRGSPKPKSPKNKMDDKKINIIGLTECGYYRYLLSRQSNKLYQKWCWILDDRSITRIENKSVTIYGEYQNQVDSLKNPYSITDLNPVKTIKVKIIPCVSL